MGLLSITDMMRITKKYFMPIFALSLAIGLLGEKYDVAATEYEMKFTYNASRGDEFGARMFSCIINEYDKFLPAKYYNKKTIEDFAKVVNDTDAEYIVIADTMSNDIEDIISYLDDPAEYYPDFCSKNTGYSFAELSLLYQNLRDIQYAKYYGNIRAGNLARDSEMVIKSYQAKVKELEETEEVDSKIAENYRNEIVTFYDSYKEAGLYNQARQVQNNTDSSNNRDQDVIEDKDLEEFTNTYDDIVYSYADYAGKATDSMHTVAYYNSIIDSYKNDDVPWRTKNSLIKKNESILDEVSKLSAQYSEVSNRTIDELYDSKVTDDLQYLILPEVTTDKPVMLIAIFLMILTFGMTIIGVFITDITKRLAAESKSADEDAEDDIVYIDTEGMDEVHKLLYEQYRTGFGELFLVYQPMVPADKNETPHSEVFIRWKSEQLGFVSPGKIVDCITDFGIFKQFNDWIIRTVCEDLAYLRSENKKMPVVHINCPYSQINDFALNDIIIEHIRRYRIPVENICLELVGRNIADSLADIMLLDEMGVTICIDRFENSNEDREIINVVKPGYIKMSLDILNNDESYAEAVERLSEINEKCHKNGIKACICGIENSEQDKLADKAGFDYKQGYYYGKPQELEK